MWVCLFVRVPPQNIITVIVIIITITIRLIIIFQILIMTNNNNDNNNDNNGIMVSAPFGFAFKPAQEGNPQKKTDPCGCVC